MADAPVIRPLRAEDLPAVATIMAGNALWQRYSVTVASAARRLQHGIETDATIAVAEVDDHVAGFVWYVPHGAFQHSGYIMLIGVASEMQARGIGHTLLAHAEDILFAASASILLLVSDFNVQAQDFYRRHGYVQIGVISDYVIPGIDELIFYKRRPGGT